MSNFMTNEEVLQRVDYLLKDQFEAVAASLSAHQSTVEAMNKDYVARVTESHQRHQDLFAPSIRTLREYFAGMAMQGVLANPTIDEGTMSKLAQSSVLMADALIAELERTAK